MTMLDGDLDLERIRRFQAGDASAFEEIVRAHQGRIVTLCRYLLGNAADAEDAAQDVFIKAFKGLPAFRPEAALATWLYRIAVNTCIDRRRRSRLRSLFLGGGRPEGAGDGAPEPLSDAPSPERLVESRELSQRIQRALQGLSPKLRAAIVLKEIEGLAYEEIAEVLETGLGTVKSRISRARDELRRALAGSTEQNGTPAV